MFFRYLRASFFFWFGLPWGVAGLVLLVVSLWQAGATHRRAQDYYEVQATVLGKQVVEGDEGDSYRATYRYADRAGQGHEGVAKLSRTEYDAVQAGQSLAVYVSGARPEDSWPASEGPPSYTLAWILGGVGVLLLPAGAIMVWLTVRDARRRVVALSGNRSVEGRVEKVSVSNVTVNDQPRYWVIWSWQGIDGQKHERKSVPLRWSWANRWRQGDPITVYLHPTVPEVGETDVFGYQGALPPPRE